MSAAVPPVLTRLAMTGVLALQHPADRPCAINCGTQQFMPPGARR
jgi:hypothetical protein